MECLRTNMRQNLQVVVGLQVAREYSEQLTSENRRAVINLVVQTALPTKNPEIVSTTVKAFMLVDLPQRAHRAAREDRTLQRAAPK